MVRKPAAVLRVKRPDARRSTSLRLAGYETSMPRSFLLLGLIGFTASLPLNSRADDYDVVVYGGTSAGVIAAVQAKAMGKSVVLVGPDKHLGGLSSGGLGFTDT